ncbi:unnamed protein product [Sympodiomycopsis kandeliae]
MLIQTSRADGPTGGGGTRSLASRRHHRMGLPPMERHGDATHVYSLPSSRLRATTGPSPDSASTASSKSYEARPGAIASVSAGNSPITELAPPRPRTAGSAPVAARKYEPTRWSLISLKRSTTGIRSLPTSPVLEQGPGTAGPSADVPPTSPSTSTSLPAYLIATLLHVPTQVLYAWPIALKGTSSGKCFVTQPSDPPAEYATFNQDATFSESIKVLTDVVQAWIRTSSMRESLRRKESKRQKGTRKIGENEQDAIWLNDSLGLAELDEAARLRTLERTWKDQGESVTPPAASSQSPTNSTTPATDAPRMQHTQGAAASGLSSASQSRSGSRPSTPRIEISEPQTSTFFGPSGISASPAHPVATPVEEAISKAHSQQRAIEAEINQWMNSASLADFTRSRPEVARKSAMSGSSSATSSGTNSPVHRPRKSVTFFEPSQPLSLPASSSPTLSGASPTAPSPRSYRPPFAPDLIDLPPAEGEEDFPDVYLPPASSSAGPSRNAKDSLTTTKSSPRPILTTGLTGPSNDAAQSSSPKSPRDSNSWKFSDITKTLSAASSQSAPANAGTLSPASPVISPTSHRKTASKLSQEIPREAGAVSSPKKSSGDGSSSARLSPSQSFADLKIAFKSFKPHLGHKKKLSAT